MDAATPDAPDADAPDATPSADTTPTPDTCAEDPDGDDCPDLIAHPRNVDPFETFNRISYTISQPIDALLIRPVAMLYQTVLPEPMRDGVRNALSNVFMPTVLVNDILQLRPRRALRTLARFVINTTLGVGGIFDIARRKPFGIPGHSNGLSDTLGVAGAGPGFYLYVPLMGPTTMRDLIGLIGDAFTQPLLLDWVSHTHVQTVRKKTTSFVTDAVSVSTPGIITLAVGGIDQRARADAELRAIKRDSVDPYAALRSSYLQNREGQIAALKAKDGAEAQVPAFDEPLADPAQPEPAPKPAPQPAPKP
jgi:phospholipid-binding lipoprotein MlaA